DRRHLVRLHDAVDQPLAAAAGRARHRTHARRQQPARRARLLFVSHPFDPAMNARTTVSGLQVATNLLEFIESQVLPGTGVEPAAFWRGFAEIVCDWRRRTQRCCANATACSWRWTPGIAR